LLVAMLERRTKLILSDQDIYVNIVGGMRITEPERDLPSAGDRFCAKGMQLKRMPLVFGEVRSIRRSPPRPTIGKAHSEAKKLGFETAIGLFRKQARNYIPPRRRCVAKRSIHS